ncbi:hypothetical protein [Alteromonas gilva]|uniref:Transposase n=1 Tax=Alteromonas gilva TaxID=2987522 RepID=A0ABT5L6X4_9ALTE|nr:hypothetical protein [Alteromonas gilva]MDC8832820.1 hypothetical protein [Alteromonas gilva]
MITYEARVAKMKTPGDAEKQILLAKKYSQRLRTKAKSPGLSLTEKLAINQKHKEAEKVLRQLRLNVFDLEDMLTANATSNTH